MRQLFINIFMMCFVVVQTLQAQSDTLHLLPEVVLSDVKLRDYSQGIHIETLSDSLIKQDITLLTEVLRDHSAIYFRENGPGGVSSASFRGTNAQQTAVVWNGININSQLTGQTDFNTISAYNYDRISVRSGGGSIPYGSGAVGGSVHLENSIRFGERFDIQAIGGYGSFDSRLAQAKTTYATDRFYIDVGGDYLASENDFKYLETDRVNENGQFENININANFGILLSEKNTITPQHLFKIHHNTFLGDRNFAGTLIAASDDRYEDRTSRTLISWEQIGNTYEGRLSAAHIYEQFRYFPTANDQGINSFGKANRFVGSYDAMYRLDRSKVLKGIVTVDHISGAGTSIENVSRQLFSAVVLYNHTVNNQFNYGVQLRQEITDDYENPFLVGVGGEYAFTKKYALSFNASRNYRIPTFNDLYWRGLGAVGNREILPETSLQAEMGQQITLNNFKANAQAFYIQTEDLIVWQPNSQNIWSPVNLRASTHYGVELTTTYTTALGDHKITSQGRYSYTISENTDTGNQLAYVPRQLASLALAHSNKFISTRLQGNYTDRVFVTGDESQQIEDYFVWDAGVQAQLLNKPEHKVKVACTLRNVFNKSYQTVLSRPNPGRNFLIQTTYTF